MKPSKEPINYRTSFSVFLIALFLYFLPTQPRANFFIGSSLYGYLSLLKDETLVNQTDRFKVNGVLTDTYNVHPEDRVLVNETFIGPHISLKLGWQVQEWQVYMDIVAPSLHVSVEDELLRSYKNIFYTEFLIGAKIFDKSNFHYGIAAGVAIHQPAQDKEKFLAINYPFIATVGYMLYFGRQENWIVDFEVKIPFYVISATKNSTQIEDSQNTYSTINTKFNRTSTALKVGVGLYYIWY